LDVSRHGRRKGFFQGEPPGVFPNFFQGGAKSSEIFFPLKTEETTFFQKISNSREGKASLQTPM